MKKILYLIPCFATGGAEMMVYELAKNLDKEKYEAYTASSVEDGELKEKFAENNLNIFVGSRQKQGGRRGVWRELKKYINEIKPDLIHSQLIISDAFGYWFKKKYKIPWVCGLQNVEYDRPWYYRALWRYILPKADSVIVVSPVVKEYALKYLNVLEKQLKVVLNGVDLEPWLKVPKISFSINTLQIATIGRVEKQKGHIYLLRALSKIRDISWQWHIFGAGSLQGILQKEAKKLGINQQIIWHGITANLSQELANIQLIVQPSLWEGLSLVVMESMASGRCVIASQAAGQDLIAHGQNGYIVANKDVAGLESIIREVFNNKEEMKRMGLNARQYAMTNFSLENNVREVEDIYDELLKIHKL